MRSSSSSPFPRCLLVRFLMVPNMSTKYLFVSGLHVSLLAAPVQCFISTSIWENINSAACDDPEEEGSGSKPMRSEATRRNVLQDITPDKGVSAQVPKRGQVSRRHQHDHYWCTPRSPVLSCPKIATCGGCCKGSSLLTKTSTSLSCLRRTRPVLCYVL